MRRQHIATPGSSASIRAGAFRGRVQGYHHSESFTRRDSHFRGRFKCFGDKSRTLNVQDCPSDVQVKKQPGPSAKGKSHKGPAEASFEVRCLVLRQTCEAFRGRGLPQLSRKPMRALMQISGLLQWFARHGDICTMEGMFQRFLGGIGL